MWALFTDVGRPFLPSLPILVYTLYLYANRTSVGQLGGDSLKDSPYFLGFLLTMFALFKIFNDVSSNSTLFAQNPSLMTQEVGAAVLTTIVGLFCRQALLALVQDEAPEEDDRLAALANAVTSHAVAFEVARQQFFREMAVERTKHTEELQATQARFLAQLRAATQARPVVEARMSVGRDASPDTRNYPTPKTGTDVPDAPDLTDAPDVPLASAHDTPTGVRSTPYTGPSGRASAIDPVTLDLGATAAATPPYPPYFGQGRGASAPRDEE